MDTESHPARADRSRQEPTGADRSRDWQPGETQELRYAQIIPVAKLFYQMLAGRPARLPDRKFNQLWSRR